MQAKPNHWTTCMQGMHYIPGYGEDTLYLLLHIFQHLLEHFDRVVLAVHPQHSGVSLRISLNSIPSQPTKQVFCLPLVILKIRETVNK